MQVPQCLVPDNTCITQLQRVGPEVRPECREAFDFCSTAVYELPSHLKITLPVMDEETLSKLYAEAYSGQATITDSNHERPTQQAEMVMAALNSRSATGLRIAEMGCASGYLLYNLRALAANGGELMCFEGDPDYHASLQKSLDKAASEVEGLRTKLVGELFTPGVLAQNSLDIFLSSHTLEHLADPCPWLAEMQRVLKPGGLIFTEVPNQDSHPAKGIKRGQFHLLYFNEETFTKMMESNGFQKVRMESTGQDLSPVRSVFQKPFG